MRRVQVAVLVVVVIAASAGGTWALTRVFRAGPEPAATGPSVRNGKIAFVRNQNRASRGTVPPSIFVMDPDGANLEQISDDQAYKASLDWSPDGTKLAFVRGRGIWVMNADGSDLTALTNNRKGQDDFPDWSPDGTRIAFTRSERSYCDTCAERPSEKNLSHIHVMNADGFGIRQLTTGLWYEHDPTWSPDGSLIAFVRSKADIEGLDPPGYKPGITPPYIYVVAPDGSPRIGTEAHLLAAMDRSAQGLEWSPDGKRFLFDGGSGIHTMSADGTAARPISVAGQGPSGLDMSAPSWSPDGTMIVFSASWGTYDDIYIVNADGSGLTQLTENVESFRTDYGPAWQPIRRGTPQVATTTPEGTEPDALVEFQEAAEAEAEAAAHAAAVAVLTEVFGPLCGVSGVGGDFDGDGRLDLAAVSYGSADGFCRGPAIKAWMLHVIWARGASGAWPLPECTRICRAFAAANLDWLEDTDELFLVSDAAASTQFVRVYALPTSEGPIRFTIADPGNEEYTGGEPFVLEYGGSDTHKSFVTCELQHQPTAFWPWDRLIATTADLSSGGSTWLVHETVFGYPSVLVGGEDPSSRLVRVFSSKTHEVPFDPTGEEPLPIAGDPCGVLD